MQVEISRSGTKKPSSGNSLTIKDKEKMKKNLFVIAAVAAVAAVSCNKELAQEQVPAGEVVTFEATTDGAESKAVLDGKVAKWENGDAITIHNGTKGFEFKTVDAGAKATFAYAGDDFSGEKFMAVYPAGNYTADVTAKTVTAAVPTYQPSRDNSFSNGAVPSIAYTENQTLAFKNASALLKFTVKGKNVKGLVFYGHNNEAVSGNVKVTLNEDNTIKSVVAQETTITENDQTETKLITWVKLWAQTDNYCFNEGTTYYISVVPQNFTKGFTAQFEIDGVGNVDVKKLDRAYDLKPNTILDLGELEYVAPSVEDLNWGVAGTMTNWADGADLAMVAEGDWLVAKNVTIEAGVEFKFRANGSWDTNRGTESVTAVAEGTEYKVVNNGQNMSAAVPAIYDIYLSKTADKMKLVKVGDLEVEEPSDEPVASDWGVVGDFNNWNGPDITMYSYKGMYVAYNVKFTAAGSFKIRKGGVWNDAANYGLETSADVEPGYYYKVVTNGGSGNIKVKAGTYDIWFDLTNKRVYVLLPGTDPATVSQGTPAAPSNWNLVGSFNNWNPGDKTYAMAAQGDYYVYKGFTCTSTVEMKFAPGSWGGDKGATSSANVVKDKKYSTGGTNIKVPAGTYDIYLKKDLKNYWFMTPGSVPAN